MDSVLAGLKWRSCIVYLDDMFFLHSPSSRFGNRIPTPPTISLLRTKNSDILCTWLRHTGFVSILRKSMMLLILKSLRISLNSSHFGVLRHIIVALFRHTPLRLRLYFDYFVITCLFNDLMTNTILSINSHNFLLQRLFSFILTGTNHFSCRQMRLV